MNNSWIEKVFLNFFENHVDLFGEHSTYLGFEENSPDKTSIPDGFNSTILGGKIFYKHRQDGTKKSFPIVIKVTPGPALIKEYHSFAFANEMNFYSKIVPVFGTLDPSIYTLFARFYHGEMRFDKMQTRSAIIFEDLKAIDYKLAEQSSFLDFEHLALMMRKLGQFHAFSYKAKNTLSHWFGPMAKNFQETNFYINTGEEVVLFRALRGFAALNENSKQVPYVENFFKNADKIYKRVLTEAEENPLAVIAHGDYLRNNVMFRYSNNNTPNDLRMIDMATCRYASPVIDLTTVLYINTDQATRDKYWDKLIDEYYVALEGTFPDNEIPSKNQILKEFVGKSFYNYLVAAYFLPFLITIDKKIPYPQDIDPDIIRKFEECKLSEISPEMCVRLHLAVGGEQGTQALKDILQDMIDRGFICEDYEFD